MKREARIAMDIDREGLLCPCSLVSCLRPPFGSLIEGAPGDEKAAYWKCEIDPTHPHSQGRRNLIGCQGQADEVDAPVDEDAHRKNEDHKLGGDFGPELALGG